MGVTRAVLPRRAVNIPPKQSLNMAHFGAFIWARGEYYGVDRVVGVAMTLYLDFLGLCAKIIGTRHSDLCINNKDIEMSLSSTMESLSKKMDDMGITEIDFERRYLFGLFTKRIHLSKQSVAVATGAPKGAVEQTSAAGEPEITGHVLKSPMVGVAYLAPEPGAKPFVKVGSTIHAGDTVALVEAMKTFNPIKSDVDGVVKKILVADGAAVEFDQPLIIIE